MTIDMAMIINMPGKLLEDPDRYKEIVRLVRQSQDLYCKLLEMGVPKEEARFVLLHGNLGDRNDNNQA